MSNLLAKNCPSETLEENDVQEIDHVTEQSHSTKPLDTDLSTEDVVRIETVPTVRGHLSSIEDNGNKLLRTTQHKHHQVTCTTYSNIGQHRPQISGYQRKFRHYQQRNQSVGIILQSELVTMLMITTLVC